MILQILHITGDIQSITMRTRIITECYSYAIASLQRLGALHRQASAFNSCGDVCLLAQMKQQHGTKLGLTL